MAGELQMAIFCLVLSSILTLVIADYSNTAQLNCQALDDNAYLESIETNMTELEWEAYSRDLVNRCSDVIPLWVWVLAFTPAFFGFGIYVVHPFK